MAGRVGYYVGMAQRFVIQAHSGWGPLHYDLMLPGGELLATWRLNDAPTDVHGSPGLQCVRIQDHRREYLTYTGPVSGERGRVDIFDSGEYQPISTEETCWEFVLDGELLAGRFELTRPSETADQWTFRLLD